MNKEKTHRAERGRRERARCSYEFHERASLLRLLKTAEMPVPAEKEAGSVETKGEDGQREPKERRKKGKNVRVGRRGSWQKIEPILAQGTRVKYRRTGKLLPDVKFRPGANFAARTWKYVTA